MLVGRFLMMVPVMAIAGSLVGKKAVPESLGTFPDRRDSVRRAASRCRHHCRAR